MLGNEARMNHPSTLGNNWKWRMGSEDMDEELIARIRELAVNAFRFLEEEEPNEEDELLAAEDTDDGAGQAETKADPAGDVAER